MAHRTPPDWTKTGTIAGYAEYLRKNADAFAVIVVRRDDAVLAACVGIKAADLGERILDDVPALMLDLAKAREEKRPARVQHGELRE
jgi:cysteine synthase